jgi:hypothetical protein
MFRNRSVPIVLATLAFVALGLVLTLLAAPADAASRTLSETYAVGSAERLDLAIPFGDLKIEGVDGGGVRVRVEATCTRDEDCEEFVENLRLESKTRGRTLHVKLEGARLRDHLDLDGLGHDDGAEENDESDLHRRGRSQYRGHADHGRHFDRDGKENIRVIVQVPRSLTLKLAMGAGVVDIAGLRHDLEINLGAGEIAVRMPERSVGAIDVELAVGEAQITQGGRTRDYARVLGGPIRWREGKGDAEIDVSLGAGSVDVTLD